MRIEAIVLLHEYLEDSSKRPTTLNVSVTPPRLYPQMRDWTCALACLRSLTSGIADIGDDEALIRKFDLTPGPLYSADIKRIGILGGVDTDIIYGSEHQGYGIEKLWNLLQSGYRIMLEWMYSFDHWTVLLGYYAIDEDADRHMMLMYDPYCGELFTIRAGHFEVMWKSSAENGPVGDFIAVRGV